MKRRQDLNRRKFLGTAPLEALGEAILVLPASAEVNASIRRVPEHCRDPGDAPRSSTVDWEMLVQGAHALGLMAQQLQLADPSSVADADLVRLYPDPNRRSDRRKTIAPSTGHDIAWHMSSRYRCQRLGGLRLLPNRVDHHLWPRFFPVRGKVDLRAPAQFDVRNPKLAHRLLLSHHIAIDLR